MAQYGYTCPKCGTFHSTSYNNSVCRNDNCKEPFIKEAGKLEQKHIVFFGPPSSGKYSAMVALAVYLNQAHCVQPLFPSNLDDIIENFQKGVMNKKTADKDSGPYSFILHLQTASDCKFLLTLVSIPWDYKVTSPMFPGTCACVVCWDMKTDVEHQRFIRELDKLRWDLKKAGSEAEEDGWTPDFKNAQLISFNAFIKKICGDFSISSEHKQKRAYCISNLLGKVRSLQYYASEENQPPILLLYNKCDTIPGEEWRITPEEENSPKYQKLLWKEIQACGNQRYFPLLNELSSTFTSILNKKFYGKCFYAQMRFSPYGSDIPSLAVPDIMQTLEHVTSTIELYLRLQLYALQYKRPGITNQEQETLVKAIKKYTIPADLPEKYLPVICETAIMLLENLSSGRYFKSDYDRIYDAHSRAERNAQLVRYQINCIKIHRVPVPQNADLLCEWLLYVSGILSVPTENVPSDTVRSLDTPFLLKAPEYRSQSAAEQLALKSSKGESSAEALCREAAARLYLFENPHDEDEKYLDTTKKQKSNILKSSLQWLGKLSKRSIS